MRGGRKNTIRLGLVNVPVQLPNATEKVAEVKTRQVAPSGAAAKQVYIDPQTEKVVPSEEMRRGVEVGDGFAIIPTESWDAIQERTKLEGIEIRGFCPEAELEARQERIRDAHFVQPQPGAAKALGLIRQAMLDTGTVAEVEFAVGSRPRLGVLRPRDDGALELVTLRSEAEVREPDEEVLAPSLVEVEDERLVAQAVSLVESMSHEDGSFLDSWTDEVVEQRNRLIESALAGEVIEAPETAEAPAAQDDDLLAALTASAESVKRAPKRKSGKAKAKATAKA